VGHSVSKHYNKEGSFEMAKSKPGTKSQAISDYLASNKEAKPQQIVDALKEKGVQVSFGLASAVKYGTKGGKKKTSAKKAKRIVAVKSQPAVTGTESIRQYISKNPKAKPKEIEAGLKAEGVKVKLSLVNSVKYAKAKQPKLGKKARRMARRATVQVAARKTPSTALSIEQLIEVKRFADSMGGADQVREALETLAQLQ
jgi:hypothetical protein